MLARNDIKSLPDYDQLNEDFKLVSKFLHTGIDLDEKGKYLECIGYYQQGLDLIKQCFKDHDFNTNIWTKGADKMKKLQSYFKQVSGRLVQINNILSNPQPIKKNQPNPNNQRKKNILKNRNFNLPPSPIPHSVPKNPNPNSKNRISPSSKSPQSFSPPTRNNNNNSNKQRIPNSDSPGFFSSVVGFFSGNPSKNKKNKSISPQNNHNNHNQQYNFQQLREAQRHQKINQKRRNKKSVNSNKNKQPGFSQPKTSVEDSPFFKGIKKEYIHSIIDEILDKDTTTSFDDIAGLQTAKQILSEAVILPQLRPDLFSGLRGPPKGVLLFGPPGNGKTMIAKAIATECQCRFFAISASSLVSKWHGESEKLARALFACARYLSPSIIFIDEIDSILSSRSSGEHEASRRLKTEFLVQIDGVNSSNNEDGTRVLVLGATNIPYELDDAILRRFSKRVYIPLPSAKSRLELLRKMLSKHGYITTLKPHDFEEIGGISKGYSGSDLAEVCREASMVPIRELGNKILEVRKESIRKINKSDFIKAIQRVKRSTDIEVIKRLEEWNSKYGSS